MKEVDKMMNNVIRRFGFESDDTIAFCELCDMDKKSLKNCLALITGWYEGLMKRGESYVLSHDR